MAKEERPFYDVEVKVTLRANSEDWAIRHILHLLERRQDLAIEIIDCYLSPEVVGVK